MVAICHKTEKKKKKKKQKQQQQVSCVLVEGNRMVELIIISPV